MSKNNHHLLGFYQKKGQVKEIYGESPFIWDSNLEVELEAVIVPLKVLPSDFGWISTEYINGIDEDLKEIMNEGRVFST